MYKTERVGIEIGSLQKAATSMAKRYGRIGIQEPEDIAQNAILRMLKRHGNAGVPSMGWLFVAVKFSALDAARVASRENRHVWRGAENEIEFYGEPDSYCRSPIALAGVVKEQAVEPDVMPQLMAMLGSLSEPLKQTLVLYAEGYIYTEIAQMTNTNVGTVRSRLHHARKKAKRMLKSLA